jgi:hypothetical protein
VVLLALLGAIPFTARWIRPPNPVSVYLEDATRIRIEALEWEKAEMLRSREQLRYFAEHDDLTGLWNHPLILERLRIEVERSPRDRLPLSVAMADLDSLPSTAKPLRLRQVSASRPVSLTATKP